MSFKKSLAGYPIIKVLTLALALFLCHIVFAYFLAWIIKPEINGYSYGVIGSVLFLFMYTFWAYILVAIAYTGLVKPGNSLKRKIGISTIITFCALLLSISPRIINGTLFEKPFVNQLYFVLPTIVLIVFLDNLIRKKSIA